MTKKSLRTGLAKPSPLTASQLCALEGAIDYMMRHFVFPSERHLAAEIGKSRCAVRFAVRKLVSKGWIEKCPDNPQGAWILWLPDGLSGYIDPREAK